MKKSDFWAKLTHSNLVKVVVLKKKKSGWGSSKRQGKDPQEVHNLAEG